MTDYSPDIPTSFDPAIYLHSELEFLHDAPTPASFSHSDELEALQHCVAKDQAEKSRAGVVIQHRAWNTADAFRSEEDHPIDTPLKHLKNSAIKPFPSGSSTDGYPSSPPSITMPFSSSPITYPPSSAPQFLLKRKRSEAERSPLKDVQANQAPKRVGGFLDDSDDEEGAAALNDHALKRRALNKLKDLPSLPPDVGHYTPPASQEEIADPEDVGMDELNDLLRSPSPARVTGIADEPPSSQPRNVLQARTASGTSFVIGKKVSKAAVSYEQLIAQRSVAVEGRAKKSFYGIDIHQLLDEAKELDVEKARAQSQHQDAVPQQSIEEVRPQSRPGKTQRTLMWTEKYRAKKFTDLVGDERTHRSVLRWLKGWDPIVFPGIARTKPKGAKNRDNEHEEQRHRKVLLLTGPPGLGKTTLAHVCARQAGYEVQEINASDERSHTVVKGRIRDMVGTENVRGINTNTASGKVRKAGKPVCVVVDEVDGVVGGSSGGGEGGFIKALIDLINLDEKNSKMLGQVSTTNAPKKKRKGDNFRLLRPLILICNDVYHPSLRPLRQSSIAEIVHIRKPALNMVITRMEKIFEKENVPADSDGVRRLCEVTWGVSTKKEGGTGTGTGEGDIRGVMVVGEWVAGRLRASHKPNAEPMRLSRKWLEDNVLNDLHHGGGAARSLGRGGAKDVVDRVFREGAGFPKQAETGPAKTGKKGVVGVAESAKRRAMERLREMVDTSGDCDRIVTDCFTAFPEKPFQDDTLLSKPCTAYEWLHFHDTLSSAVHGSQEWELYPYLSQSVLAFHDLFASPRHQASNPTADPDAAPSPFSGPTAAWQASEQRKANRDHLMSLQSTLSLPLTRMFRSPEELATELLPYVLRMLSPDVKPVLVNTGSTGSRSAATASVRKASEKALVNRAVQAMAATGVRFERSRVEFEDPMNRNGGWVLRMEPALDQLGAFETLEGRKDDKVRYAVRSVLETEWKKEALKIEAEMRKKRGGGHELVEAHPGTDTAPLPPIAAGEKVKRDFFGRVVIAKPLLPGEAPVKEVRSGDEGRIWVSFHEGFSNAVRKPVTIDELMRGL
ncbi:hypothetical protein BDV96DRAFT_503772 [Lophiotrema nucula]|uniref:AAA+ ATPase domain-containing protein n=1 Tax=Lophiotrema nucula TaxID=690887 RepID=A0A6A5YNL7_9PLEO|nr:hypothetical protein BDV96DRAFT_503772 [Lophiotrema nucula]